MAAFNKVILLGNVSREIELRTISSGTAVVNLGMAVNDRVKRNNEWTDEATFVDVTLWGRTAEIAHEYLKKGSSVMIEGRLKLDTWEKDGEKRSKLSVVGEKMQMIGSKSSSHGKSTKPVDDAAAANGSRKTERPQLSAIPSGDDVPF